VIKKEKNVVLQNVKRKCVVEVIMRQMNRGIKTVKVQGVKRKYDSLL